MTTTADSIDTTMYIHVYMLYATMKLNILCNTMHLPRGRFTHFIRRRTSIIINKYGGNSTGKAPETKQPRPHYT